MTLFGSAMSPYVRKVLAFAAEKGVALEATRVPPRSLDPMFQAASPFGKMPSLSISDNLRPSPAPEDSVWGIYPRAYFTRRLRAAGLVLIG